MTPEKFLAQPEIYARIQALLKPSFHIDPETFTDIVDTTVFAYDKFRRESIVAGCDQVREIEFNVQP